MSEVPEKQRLDKWLWHARLYRSRTSATNAVLGSRVRINRKIVVKSHASIRPGDVITLALWNHVKIIEVLAIAMRRCSVIGAQLLYNELNAHKPLHKTELGCRKEPPLGDQYFAINRQ